MTDRDKDSQKVMKSKQETMNKQAERRRDSVRPIKPGVMNRKPMPAKAIVLYQNYSKWEVFYFDEHGERIYEKVFCNEEDTCLHIYELFKSNK